MESELIDGEIGDEEMDCDDEYVKKFKYTAERCIPIRYLYCIW